MPSASKILIILGIVLIAAGLIWWLVGRWIPLGRLPGDIVYEKGNVKFYFPIVTCILISVIGSLIMMLFRR
ncbi:DUF2905 domain-containing protein [Paenibacillus sp. JTLBN-2024]|jgi:hypothetical protein|uniref:Membrane protein n=1 Tax=Paenibacillus cookii TaxID=157839 RepID=A0ABQ4LZU7_9BACL|nr:DUF2905 domain-containing protein [Paenibacillus cookii]KHF37282.1 hypothetical protein CM49_00299 [Paenibacillus sp. P1XP2]GIO68787.1 membrane protein [Paenibacillus cookii]HWO54278.1 DUF2905 domain-containing protein [Paenibacillus cookii]